MRIEPVKSQPVVVAAQKPATEKAREETAFDGIFESIRLSPIQTGYDSAKDASALDLPVLKDDHPSTADVLVSYSSLGLAMTHVLITTPTHSDALIDAQSMTDVGQGKVGVKIGQGGQSVSVKTFVSRAIGSSQSPGSFVLTSEGAENSQGPHKNLRGEGLTNLQSTSPGTTDDGISGRNTGGVSRTAPWLISNISYTDTTYSNVLEPSVKADVLVKTLPLMPADGTAMQAVKDMTRKTWLSETNLAQRSVFEPSYGTTVLVKAVSPLIDGTKELLVSNSVPPAFVDEAAVHVRNKLVDSPVQSAFLVEPVIVKASSVITLQPINNESSVAIETFTDGLGNNARSAHQFAPSNLYANAMLIARTGIFRDTTKESVSTDHRLRLSAENSGVAVSGASVELGLRMPIIEPPIASASLQALHMEILSFTSNPERPAMTLEISPPEYGKLIVSAEREQSGRVIVNIVTESAAAKFALNESLPKPTTTLEVRVYTADEYREWAEQPKQDSQQQAHHEQTKKNTKKSQVEFKV